MIFFPTSVIQIDFYRGDLTYNNNCKTQEKLTNYYW